MFVLALGEDGAPGAGTSILVSFLNCGQRVASSSENYLLFGCDVDESADVVNQFIARFVRDLQYLESTVFDIGGRKVEFKVGELINDMKMLARLAGELSNTSTYFSIFANVTQIPMILTGNFPLKQKQTKRKPKQQVNKRDVIRKTLIKITSTTTGHHGRMKKGCQMQRGFH